MSIGNRLGVPPPMKIVFGANGTVNPSPKDLLLSHQVDESNHALGRLPGDAVKVAVMTFVEAKRYVEIQRRKSAQRGPVEVKVGHPQLEMEEAMSASATRKNSRSEHCSCETLFLPVWFVYASLS